MRTGHSDIFFRSRMYRDYFFPVPHDRSRTIIRKSAGIPCTDSGYTYPFPVRLMLTAFLDVPFSPQMQLLLLFSGSVLPQVFYIGMP